MRGAGQVAFEQVVFDRQVGVLQAQALVHAPDVGAGAQSAGFEGGRVCDIWAQGVGFSLQSAFLLSCGSNACSRTIVVVTWLHYSISTGIAMTITTLSSREFNQGASEAKRAANNGPVFITDRGKPAHVLLSFDDYQKLTKQRRNIADALAMPGIADIEFEPPRVTIQNRPADFS